MSHKQHKSKKEIYIKDIFNCQIHSLNEPKQKLSYNCGCGVSERTI